MADIRKNGKQYGLICPKKAPLSAPKAINVFGNDDESDEEDGTDWVKKALKAEGEKNRSKKQTRLNIQKALNEDPTICQYDEVFDDMKRNEEQGKSKKKEVKKAKYIENLLKTADRRKREQEHRIERMVQKEREAEGAMYADKESFVTSAYRAKLEEFKKMEDEEQNMDRLESIGDVTKQQDMSGFYRHFFHQTVTDKNSGEASTSEMANGEIKNDKDEKEIIEKIDRDDVLPSTSDSGESSDSNTESRVKASKKSPKIGVKKQSRQYRRRVVEASDSEPENDEPKIKEEADITNEESLFEEKPSEDKQYTPVKKKIKPLVDDKRLMKDNDKIVGEKLVEKTKLSDNEISVAKPDIIENTVIIEAEEKKKKEEEKINKVSIWEKRTVGPIFEAALQRYYTRKATRLSGS